MAADTNLKALQRMLDLSVVARVELPMDSEKSNQALAELQRILEPMVDLARNGFSADTPNPMDQARAFREALEKLPRYDMEDFVYCMERQQRLVRDPDGDYIKREDALQALATLSATSPLLCGHTQDSISSSDEGTSYCRVCEAEARGSAPTNDLLKTDNVSRSGAAPTEPESCFQNGKGSALPSGEVVEIRDGDGGGQSVFLNGRFVWTCWFDEDVQAFANNLRQALRAASAPAEGGEVEKLKRRLRQLQSHFWDVEEEARQAVLEMRFALRMKWMAPGGPFERAVNQLEAVLDRDPSQSASPQGEAESFELKRLRHREAELRAVCPEDVDAVEHIENLRAQLTEKDRELEEMRNELTHERAQSDHIRAQRDAKDRDLGAAISFRVERERELGDRIAELEAELDGANRLLRKLDLAHTNSQDHKCRLGRDGVCTRGFVGPDGECLDAELRAYVTALGPSAEHPEGGE